MNFDHCFALLDDASAADPAAARSRLYTGLTETLECSDAAAWPQLLAQMQEALARGLYAVPLLTYELGGHLLGIDAHAVPGALARVLLFQHCEHLSAPQVQEWLKERAGEGPAGIAGVRANVDEEAFTAALARIHALIAAGDTYQVNYTYRLRFDAFGTVHALYARLRARQPVPYGALVALPDGGALLSLSPELFIRHAGGELLARPMKGTAPASPDDAENARRAAALAADTKNRAENLMIVDLLRNDLGRVAQTGSVEVSALFEVQRYSSVLQMTSTVKAQLRGDATLADIFMALYPCGSITGAPKRRTMEIIHEIEPAPRGIYTGAIGWFDPPQAGRDIGAFCLSVPIRTLTLQPQARGVRAGEMGVGAGIVYDSDPVEEYAECQLKARFLTGLSNEFELFETMRADHETGVRHQGRHLARMSASARYFGFPFDAQAATAALNQACAGFEPGVRYRLRLALGQSGEFRVQSAPLAALAEPVGLLVAGDAVRSDDLFARHKTSIRSRYDAAWREAETQGGFDTLFFNERGELAEGGRCNVFVRVNGRWLTPPLSCGVLPGVMRAVLLDAPAWKASEGVITRTMLEHADDIIVCNALRGPLRAFLLV
ncbi:aminodeoxychorismate synthase component I [Massilia sp. R2A-15]|uniref:aminodeoxychorismate synthase component I n=1 Tax=Massilia sp. R2A-15 TaxID=3064278 RepID=UPI0027335546|nr:aminodeoxychorismate synthase component I [Massilia sp. R2A-15]WLI89018.1 aminodeoxychorismate synthase component I [Massilia sp. R2A-15]